MKIRLAQFEDLENLHRAHMRSIREVCSKDYTPEQIEAWGGRSLCDVEEKRNLGLATRCMWVVEAEHQILGFGQWIPPENDSIRAYILALYLAPEAIGQGIGKKLLQWMEKEAIERGAKELALDSTLTSVGFYEKQGYKRTSVPQPYDVGTCKIPCIPMLKEI